MERRTAIAGLGGLLAVTWATPTGAQRGRRETSREMVDRLKRSIESARAIPPREIRIYVAFQDAVELGLAAARRAQSERDTFAWIAAAYWSSVAVGGQWGELVGRHGLHSLDVLRPILQRAREQALVVLDECRRLRAQDHAEIAANAFSIDQAVIFCASCAVEATAFLKDTHRLSDVGFALSRISTSFVADRSAIYWLTGAELDALAGSHAGALRASVRALEIGGDAPLKADGMSRSAVFARAARLRMVRAASIAAISAGALGRWDEAWRYLAAARLREWGGTVPRRPWQMTIEMFDAVVALVTTPAGSQVWLANRDEGPSSTKVFPAAATSQQDLQRFLSFGGPRLAGGPCSGWFMMVGCLDAAGQRETMGRSRSFVNELDRFGQIVPPDSGAAIAAALREAESKGARRVAWIADPLVAQWPIAAIRTQDGVSAEGALDIALVGNHRQVTARGARSSRAGATRVLPIPGGDADIPLAAVERRVIEALGRVAVRTSQPNVLHVATHAGLTWRGIEIQVDTDRTILVGELAQSDYWRPRPELVILAACASTMDLTAAAGDNLAVESPAQELIERGARAVVASLWTVFDDAAFCFSSRLHWELRRGGAEPLAAFGRAKRWLRSATHADIVGHVEALRAAGVLSSGDEQIALQSVAHRPRSGPAFRTHDWAVWTYWGV
jgi:hypothetical protein